MAVATDRLAGLGLVAFAVSVFLYYTVWVIVLPFVDPDQPIHKFFLPRFYAVAGPLVAGVIALTLIGLFVIRVSLKAKAKKS